MDRYTPEKPECGPVRLLMVAIQNYQGSYYSWRQAHDPIAQDTARLQLQLAQEQLLSLMAEPLLTVARAWIRNAYGKELTSVVADDAVQSLALTLYLEVIEELLDIQIDQFKNPLNLIKTIAHRRLIDRYRREKHLTTLRMALGSDNAAALSDIPEQNVVDPESLDWEETLITRLYNEASAQEIWTFWESTLTPEDQQIMRRWEKDPPTPFRELAGALGPGWTEGMVKMRHHRVIQRTREYFKRGLTPPDLIARAYS